MGVFDYFGDKFVIVVASVFKVVFAHEGVSDFMIFGFFEVVDVVCKIVFVDVANHKKLDRGIFSVDEFAREDDEVNITHFPDTFDHFFFIGSGFDDDVLEFI